MFLIKSLSSGLRTEAVRFLKFESNFVARRRDTKKLYTRSVATCNHAGVQNCRSFVTDVTADIENNRI
jgi:hypothetical protein